MSKIILLNGPSSSGKTTLAKQLANQLNEIIYLSLDQHLEQMMQSHQQQYPTLLDERGELQSTVFAGLASRWVLGFHDVIEAHLALGHDLIVDHVLQESLWKQDLVSRLKPEQVIFVGLACGLSELERREQQREDRQPGLAKSQFEKVHLDCDYQLFLHTDQLSLNECTEQVLKLWNIKK